MFEIGNTLREARLRRGLDILDCEAETKIRAKYLRAMEEEQFDLMPSPTYVRGFLRAYAESLDLDGQLVLDEYESRFDAFESPAAEHRRGAAPRPRERAGGGPHRAAGRGGEGEGGRGGRRTRRRRSTEAQLLWLAIGGVMAVALLIWLGVGESADRAPVSDAPAPAEQVESAREPVPEPDNTADEGPVPPERVEIVLTGVGDIGSYLEVRGGGADGHVVYSDILGSGQSVSYNVRRPIWVAAGNTDGLEVTIDEEPAEVAGGTANFLIGRDGVERVD